MSIVMTLAGGVLASAEPPNSIHLSPQSYRGLCAEPQRATSTLPVPTGAGWCVRAGNKIQCDVEGAEPLDVPVTQVCASGAIQVRPGRRVDLVAALSPGQFEVDWLQAGPTVSILATRRLPASNEVHFTVSGDANRLVRFRRGGASPVTVAAHAVLDGHWRLPEAVPGGELVVWSLPSRIAPSSIEVTGSGWSGTLPAKPGVSARQVLPDGDYETRLVFDGGVHGASQTVRIAAGASTFLVSRTDDLGGVTFNFDDSACRQVGEIAIDRLDTQRLERPDGLTIVQSNVPELAIAASSTCATTVSGLRPGQYDAIFRAGGVPWTHRVFSVAAAQIAIVGVTTEITAQGTVTWNGSPVAGLTLQFVADQTGHSERHSTTTDDNGNYSLTLPNSGDYRVNFERKDLALIRQDQRASIKIGQNDLDWSLQGGEVRISLSGYDHRNYLNVVIDKVPMDQGVVRTPIAVDPTTTLPISIPGLGFGTYKVRCTLVNDAPLSDDTEFSVDAEHAVASITLTLRAPQ